MKTEPLYKSIKDEITEKILGGEFAPGDRIMPENEMTEHYGVSRVTVRNALDKLVEAGLVERMRGKGTFVKDRNAGFRRRDKGKGLSPMISFIIPILNDTHTIRLFDGMYQAADRQGYHVTLYQTFHDQKREETCISAALNDGADGIVIYPIQNERYNEEIIKLALSRFPTVLIDRSLEGININAVVTDNEKAAYDAARRLIDKGHDKIGYITPALDLALTLQDRYAGYARAMEEAGLDIDPKNIIQYDEVLSRMTPGEERDSAKRSKVVDFLKDALDRNVTAFICAELQETMLLIRIAAQLGLSIPEDFSYIGFDDFTGSDFFAVPPSVIRQDSEGIGQRAFAILKELIDGKREIFETEKIEASLIERESVKKLN